MPFVARLRKPSKDPSITYPVYKDITYEQYNDLVFELSAILRDCVKSSSTKALLKLDPQHYSCWPYYFISMLYYDFHNLVIQSQYSAYLEKILLQRVIRGKWSVCTNSP